MSLRTSPSRYGAQFFDRHREGALSSARRVVPLLLEMVPCRSVLDVGCGTGTWLSVFEENGVGDVQGVDGSYVDTVALDIDEGRFLATNLEEPFRFTRGFDLVVSLEVAEHLDAKFAHGFVSSLVAHAPVVLFSAAIPFQGGTHHVNEQWPEYWAALFAGHGYVPVDCLRRRLWQDQRVDWWYAQNMLVFVAETSLPEYPALKRELDFAGTAQLSLVHPRRYLEWVEWGIGQDRELHRFQR